MTAYSLPGAWTYRSFYNNPDAVGKLGELLLAEGELTFDVTSDGSIRGQLAFRSDPPQASDARLALIGGFHDGTPATARFQGVGVATSSANGWIYDYIAYFVPIWPSGEGQRDALVGSVIRTVPHAGSGGATRPAGAVFSFIAVRRDFPEPSLVIPLPEKLLAVLASRHHRLHHMVWHGVRNSWLDPQVTDQQRKQIADLGWAPPRPALDPIHSPMVDNSSGEDFLFMHRQMVLEVAEIMRSLKLPPIEGWQSIPAPGPVAIEPQYGSGGSGALRPPGNPDGFSVPLPWFDPTDEMSNRRIAVVKSDHHFWARMRWWDRKCKNPAYLSKLSLGELGSIIETSVHNDMHMRWASIPRDPETGLPIPSGRQDADITKKWDNPKYDFLGEFYSSHVNPVFWRLHGWVDARVNDWFAAHEAEHSGDVQRADVDGTPWFAVGKWVGAADPWSGPMDMMHAMDSSSNPAHHHPGDEVSRMEKVVAILYGAPASETRLALQQLAAGGRAWLSHRTWF
jgi:hypothetical protein